MDLATIGDNITDCYLGVGQMFPGGNAVNVAVAAARGGGSAGYVGRVGDDHRGSMLRDALVAEGVDVRCLRSIAGGITAWAEVTHQYGDRTFGSHDRGVALFRPTPEDLAYVADATIVHTTYCSGMEGELPRLAAVSRLSFDFNDSADQYAADLLPYVDIAEFSAAHLSEADCVDLVHWAHAAGPSLVLATRGPCGAMCFDGNQILSVAAASTQVIDTLGAGDAFIGRALLGLARHEPLADVLAHSTEVAARACAGWGAFGHGEPLPTTPADTSRSNTTAPAVPQSPCRP